jgi:hypothetical protein
MSIPSVKIGRLALRHEGNNWNAYYAMPGTMVGAIFLGSITMAAIHSNEERKLAFMQMMRDIVADVIEMETGQRPTWPDGVQPAPEHERAGHS